MQLMNTFKHGSTNDHLFKVVFIEGTKLVSGGQDGSAHLYDCWSGLLVKKLEHSHCRFFSFIHSSQPVFMFHFTAGEFLQTMTVGNMHLPESLFLILWCTDSHSCRKNVNCNSYLCYQGVGGEKTRWTFRFVSPNSSHHTSNMQLFNCQNSALHDFCNNLQYGNCSKLQQTCVS